MFRDPRSLVNPKHFVFQVDAAIAKTEGEFHLRRRLLMTRLNASVKSFLWPERTQR